MTAQLNMLIRLRQYEVDRGQIQLAMVLQQERALAEQVAALDQQAEIHRTQLSGLCRCGQLDIAAMRLRQQYLQLLAAQRSELQTQFDVAQRVTQEHRGRLLAADQRLKIAEQLREAALHDASTQRVRRETLDCEDSWRISSRRS